MLIVLNKYWFLQNKLYFFFETYRVPITKPNFTINNIKYLIYYLSFYYLLISKTGALITSVYIFILEPNTNYSNKMKIL